jgi:hypothetical protein
LVEYPHIHLQRRLERPVLLNRLAIRELNHHCKASRSSLLHKELGINRSNLLCKAWGVSQSSHLYRTIVVNRFNSPVSAYIWGPGVRFVWSTA